MVSRRRRRRFIARKCWFFCRAVVIGMECSRSPRALYDIATHSWLGGQHGEEAKDEDEVGGQERRTEDQAPEEEVSYAPLLSLRLRTTSMTASKRAGASRDTLSASRSCFDTAGPGRRRRASARQGLRWHRSDIIGGRWLWREADLRTPRSARSLVDHLEQRALADALGFFMRRPPGRRAV